MSFLRNAKEENIEVDLQADKKRIVIGGREYSLPHLIAIGLKEFELNVGNGKINIRGRFSRLPSLERIEPDVIKVKSSNEELPSEAYEVPKFDKRSFRIKRAFLRFEEDNDKVVLKLKDNDFIKVSELKIVSKVSSDVNVILSPYVIGAVWLRGPLRIELKESREILEIRALPV